MTDEEVKALPKIKLTFKHIEINTKGEPFSIWRDEDGKERHYMIKGRKQPVDASPGMIYSFPQTSNGGIIPSHGKYVSRIEGDEVIEWSAIHRANKQRLAAIKSLAKEVKTELLKKAIEPVGKAYEKMNAPQRAHLIAWVVGEIVKYGE